MTGIDPQMQWLCGLLAELLGDEEWELPSSEELFGTPRNSATALLQGAANGEAVSPDELLRLLLPLGHRSLPARMVQDRLASRVISGLAATVRTDMSSEAYLTVWWQARRTRFLDIDLPVRSSTEAAILTDVRVRLPMPWPAEFEPPQYSVRMLGTEVDPIPRRRGSWKATGCRRGGTDAALVVTGGSSKRPMSPTARGGRPGEPRISYQRPYLASDEEGTRTPLTDTDLTSLPDVALARSSWTMVDGDYVVITVKGIGEADLMDLTQSLQLVATP